ncbi:ATP-binding cassette domain-containing protein [Terriglobus albidus]|uniref:ATP-binding cassette domain-containing protein n=1 Tax=Terriglobus albidus TaxID=1592106 RepID=A0A5B9EBF8_9BACT|nr:ATP-binding cassette domain-containing protein [Terriglobus albidus]QEE29034.1 ATP-binding cassette domain-containing protein [Terriglobus albidus]
MCEASVEPFLLFEHVNVARGSQRVLHDINLSIRPGENVVILGPNGCGKSTLIKTMTCEIYPLVEPGMRVRIFGRERWDLQELRRRLGVVSPELPGKPTLKTTGLDAVVSGFFSSSTLWPNLTITDEMRSKAEDALRLVEGDVLGEKLVGQMSAGQQRRVMIARALVRSNEMLLLDEPSNALDIAAQRSLRLTLRRLAQRGTGILLITHHIEDILPEIDRVIMMRDGRIVADGAKRHLLTGERLSQLFDTEVELQERNGFYSMA